jgi:hypothetical protein
MPLLSSEKQRRNRVLNLTAWLTLAGVLALVAGSVPATAAQAPTTCVGEVPPGSSAGAASELGFFLVGDEQFDLRFGESRKPQMRQVAVAAYTNRVPPRNVTATLDEGLVSAEGHAIGGFTTAAEVVRVGNAATPTTIRVCIGVDPARIGDLRPGRYRGAVVLRADNYQDAAIPVVATFRAPRGEGFKWAAAGVVLGLTVKMLTELGSGRKPRRPGAKQALRDYVLQWSFPLALILGVLTGWLGFVEMYESNATWGVGGDADSLKLLATCFGFQMGSIGGADMTKRLAG